VTIETQPLFAGRYELGRLLGGGTADVYLGTDTRLRRPVVVKIARSGPDIEDVDRFDNEMRLLAGLADPGLVTLFDAGTVDGKAYLVMQYVPGGTLGERIHREGALPADEVGRIGAALAESLAYLHEHQVVHRDLKPGNVLIDGEGKVHLADFGIARTMDSARVTATGLVIGTPAYLSPEQARGEPITPASDLYALGLVLLECLTGRREYVGAPLEVAIARLHRPPSIPEDLPAPWPGLLAGLTADDATVRPTARHVADVLAGRVTMPLPAVPPIPVARHQWATPAPLPTRRRRRGLVAGVAAAGLTALAAGALVLASPWQGDQGTPSDGAGAGTSGPATPGAGKGQPAAPAANQQSAQHTGNRGPGNSGAGRPTSAPAGGGGPGGGGPGPGGGAGGPGTSAPPRTSGPANPTTEPPATSDPTTEPPPSTTPPPPNEQPSPTGGARNHRTTTA
jgi:serine/threonine protein kinase